MSRCRWVASPLSSDALIRCCQLPTVAHATALWVLFFLRVLGYYVDTKSAESIDVFLRDIYWMCIRPEKETLSIISHGFDREPIILTSNTMH